MADWLIHATRPASRATNSMKLLFLALSFLLGSTHALYYDGLDSYSIYPRLDLHLCRNSSLSFDFSLSTSLNKYLRPGSKDDRPQPAKSRAQLLIYAEQQMQPKDSAG